MRIDRVEAFAVRYPEPNNDGKIRSLTLVRIETDDGLVGWGEAITGGQETSLAVAFVVERRLAPTRPRPRPARCRRRLDRDARRDLLGRQRRHRHLRHQRHRHGALGHRRARPPGSRSHRAAGRQAARPAAGLRLDHLRHRRPRPRRPGVPGLRRPRATASSRAAGATTCRSPSAATRRATWPSRARSATRSARTSEMIVDVVALAGWDSEPRHPDVPGDSTTTCRLYWLEDPLAGAGPRRLPAAPRRGRHAHLHRREGLARGALPGPHRLGRGRRDHGRPGQGGGRHRHLARHRAWPPPRASPGTPTPGAAR